MQSLRTRRPSETRTVKRQASKLEKKPINKNVRKSTVDDKIKKRMSLRYAEISAPTDASVPDVPSVPIGLRPGAARDPDEIVLERASFREDPKATDQRLLGKEDFDPDTYLKAKLANSTEAELKSLQSSLRSSKDDTAVELQRNVFKNYAEFVHISKEISVLENDVLELKESLSEWKSMPSLLHIDESASASERRRNVRSSIADLRVLYANQMQTLHTQIEGSAKFVPTTPGRHIIYEMDGIHALNAATYRVSNTVKFVVLDDSVLVAKRRRRNNGEGGRLVAERCWPLHEMLVLDTKDTATMTNVFKVRRQKETYVYRTEAASDKKILLGQFRQVAEELAIRKRKEREGEHERRKSMWTSGDRASMNPDTMPPLPDWMAELARKAGVDGDTSARDKSESDARFISDFSDDLTVAIALRSWERAVELVEDGRTKATSIPSLNAKLTPLTASLTSALLDALSVPGNRKNTAVGLIGHLLKLGQGPAARSTFLNARAGAMDRYVRAIRFEGHVGMYVHDLAVVVFTGIKHTADWFLAGFVEHDMTSTLIDWAKKQIEMYAERFRKQVYSSDAEQQTVKEALKITHSQSRKLLQEYGLDFRFLLDELLVQNPQTNDTCVVSATFHAPSLGPSISRSHTPQSTSSTVSSSVPPIPPIPLAPDSPARTTTRSPMPMRPPSSSATLVKSTWEH
ncbi:Cullin repeat-like-containing domain protein [Suillus clintonianus]|uniref:Cullin repeat-like-containing domain protein n=1 Tax=Suillus clintonianus TaxID=1904413 RepID=UPI001B870E42|nr:Cullin repeat-like-containing domain protein [Suillus clintonianus]KAG2155748.1 Cullin repeat-like-containing domain protein [Suillus clintonianus]